MFDWLRRLTTQSRDRTEIGALDARAFADMGVSREQALNLARMPKAVVDRVQAMGQVFGLGAAAMARDRAEWLQMVETCAQCRNKAQCRRFLRQNARRREGAGFCPNRALFAGQAAMAQRASA